LAEYDAYQEGYSDGYDAGEAATLAALTPVIEELEALEATVARLRSQVESMIPYRGF